MNFDENGTPFIALPEPHSNIIITHSRFEDGDVLIPMMNDPRVYMNLTGPAFPYTQKDWEEFFSKTEKSRSEALAEWKEIEKSKMEAGDDGKDFKRWIGGTPVNCLREIDPETKQQRFIGHISVRRRGFLAIRDKAERNRVEEENASRKAGDPLIEWEIGYFLLPAVHGRGIMPLAIRTLIHELMVPHMNVKQLTGAYIDHNNASKRVFEKNGFVYFQHISDAMELPESKTGVKGKMVSMTVMKWEPEQ